MSIKKYTFKEQVRGLPVKQLAVIAVMRFAEPMTFTSLFPYIYFMVKSFEICPEHEIPTYAVYITSAFAFSQCLTGILWGRMSDKYGRKPIVLIGLSGSAVCMLLFGLSRNFYWALGARCLAGLLNGNVGVIRTILGETAKERRHQAIAFSIMPLLWQIGCVFGPMVGGYLAQPVSAHPGWFEHDGLVGDGQLLQLFTTYPFLLPNIVITVLMVCSILVCFFFMEETHDLKKYDYDVGLAMSRRATSWFTRVVLKKKNKQNISVDFEGVETPVDEESEPLLKAHSRVASSNSVATEATLLNPNLQQPSPVDKLDVSWGAVLCPPVVQALIAGCILAGHCVTYEELLPNFFESPIEPGSKFPWKLQGGLGMDAEVVGNFLSANGLVGIFVMLVLYPWADTTFGSLRVFKFTSKVFPLLYFVVPYFVFLTDLPPWASSLIITANLFVRTIFNAMVNPAFMLLANRSAAHTRHLGVVNGTVQMASAFARAIGPVLWGALMTFGQKTGYVQIPWWSLGGVAAVGAVQALWMTDRDESGVPFY